MFGSKKQSGVPISQMRHRITIEQMTESSDGQGGAVVNWVEYRTVWAKLDPVKSSQRYFGEQLQQQRTHTITMRYVGGMSNEMRVIFQDRTFQIHGIRNPDERKFWLILDCEENQAT